MTDGWQDLGGQFFSKPVNPQIADFRDPVQGVFRNCMLVAALSSLTWVRRNWILNQGGPQYQVNLNSGAAVPVAATRDQYVANSVPVGSTSNNANEIWPAILEKTYAKFCEVTITQDLAPGDLTQPSVEPDFSHLPTGTEWGGNPVTAMTYLFPVRTTALFQPLQQKPADGSYAFSFAGKGSDVCYDFIKSVLCDKYGKTKYPLGTWTYANNPGGGAYDATVVADHSYSLLGIYEPGDGTQNIILRNPYGKTDPNSPLISQKNGTWNVPDNQYSSGTVIVNPLVKTLSLPFNANGIFAVNTATFGTYFEWFGLAY